MKNECIELVPADLSLWEQVADYYRRNRDFLERFEPLRDEEFYSIERQTDNLRGEVRRMEEGREYRFYIRPAGDQGKIIGSIGLSNVVMGAFKSAFLGYKLDREFINRGYMTMAVNMVVEYAFGEIGLHRIEANVMPWNSASLRVLEKNGFENEGMSKYYLNINGVWEDHIHMVKINYAMHGHM